MRSSLLLIFCTLFLNISIGFSQKNNKEIHIKKTTVPIKLDGKLDEAAWQVSEIANDFFMNKPFDTAYAKSKSVVRITFDEKFIYVGLEAEQLKNTYTVNSYKRDFESGSSDVFSVSFDPFKDKLNGMQFGVSPLNVQREGLVSLGEEVDFSWDNKWYSKVTNYEDHWVLEMAIPFTTLRYKVSEGSNTWAINFGRFFMKTNEASTWSPVPRNFKPVNLAFAGLLIWDDAPPKPGANISLIPYLSSNYSKDFPRNENLEASKPTASNKFGAGLDAKIAITPSLNLDLTVNPDFSQVEVDAQQTNLSRFELFFPEKRQFFIENSDLFGTFGFPSSRPFFSRRIGLTRNKFTGLVEQVPIIGGARLSGKLNDNWRIGVMNMQTAKLNHTDNEFSPATNFSVGVVQRKVFSRSYIGGIIVNKENVFKNLPASSTEGIDKYNRMAGLEFNYYSPDNRLETETAYHQSFSPGAGKDASMINQYIGYHHPNLDINFGVARLGKDYNTEVGFTPRPGVYNVFRPIMLIFNPKNQKVAKKINSFGIGMDGSDVFDLNGKRLDTEAPIFLFINTPIGTEVSAGYYMAFTRLQFPFDITNASENPNPDFSRNVVELPVDVYRTRNIFLNLETSKRNNLYGEFLIYGGNNFRSVTINEGKILGIESTFNYRIQPYGKLAMDVYYTDIKMQKPYNSVKYWLLGPKAEMSFSKSVFLSTYFQYNSQTNNTNINSRLQWRFKPVSDVFLVFTDNYFAEQIPRFGIQPWTPKNRALILKMTYWLNV
ncbi:DUF5916 domain-containing protein [Lacihabitans soyangensis]|uniref:Hydrolase n=1 Tax=Lacihabitans soyangensis TaxID=869394 RepID=A0AAE3H075_9BACT|nr:DUF5916 domain-containing protein [Lacihabitans soyangensis]MCP9762393.1 hydrolase [Lacihabitans soyangensis]